MTDSREILFQQTARRNTIAGRLQIQRDAGEAVDSSKRARPLFGSIIDRYYTQLFGVDLPGGNEKHDVYVNMHSNKVCVVGLAPSHFLLKNKATIKRVSFDVEVNGRRRDLSKMVISGKKKHGAFKLQANSILAEVEDSDGNVYSIPAYAHFVALLPIVTRVALSLASLVVRVCWTTSTVVPTELLWK